MMRSLFSGVSGLKTHQTKMDVIGNNIANVNTVAYKSSSITFSELMYQTTQNASGPNAATGTAGTNARQIGLGVTTGAISNSVTTAGATQNTGNPFDLKISGEAFFVVNNGKSNLFTRDGSFFVDAAGNLAMTSTGYNVMGWKYDETTQAIKKDTVTPLRIMSPEYMKYPAEATSLGHFTGIIDRLDADVTSISGKTVNFSFYDKAGYSYTAKFSVKQLGVNTTTGTRDYALELTDVLDADNKSVKSEYPNITMGGKEDYAYAAAVTLSQPANYTITTNGYQVDGGTVQTWDTLFDAGGNPSEALNTMAAAYGYSAREFLSLNVTGNVNMETALKAAGAGALDGTVTGALTGTADAVIGEHTTVIRYNTSDASFNSVGGGTSTTATLNLPYTNFTNVAIDFSTTSNENNSGSSTLTAKSGDTDGYGTGRKVGKMEGVAIEDSGVIYATYTNGQKRILGQIAVAEFANASGLSKEGDNLYAATSNSGDFDGIGVDVKENGGKISTGVLEMSNVDLSSEFTEMITTQRGFQANSRIITVSDTLLEELVNLKR